MHHRHRRKSVVVGKKIVYITQYRNTAVEVLKEYARKGFKGGVEKETDATGEQMYVVYIYPRE